MDHGFNPTLVRLRLVCDFTVTGDQNKFQSHAGSIEAQHTVGARVSKSWFQSHAGSIEAAQCGRQVW